MSAYDLIRELQKEVFLNKAQEVQKRKEILSSRLTKSKTSNDKSFLDILNEQKKEIESKKIS